LVARAPFFVWTELRDQSGHPSALEETLAVYVSQTLLSSSCTSLAFDVRLHFSLVSGQIDRGAPESSWARRH